jgi:hypothetical protein
LIIVGERAQLRRKTRAQLSSRIDLAELGLATIADGADVSELRQAFETFGLYATLRQGVGDPRALGVVGVNDEGLRSALAINLALVASRDGFRVALIDAVAGGSALTSAVAVSASGRTGARGALHDSYENVLLVLPSLDREPARRLCPERALGELKSFRGRLDLIVCDCPEDEDPGAIALLTEVDDFVALDGYSPSGKSRSAAATAIAARLRARVRLIVQAGQRERARSRLGDGPARVRRPGRLGGLARRSASTRIGDRNDSSSPASLRD